MFCSTTLEYGFLLIHGLSLSLASGSPALEFSAPAAMPSFLHEFRSLCSDAQLM